MPKGTIALSDNRYGEGGVMRRIFFMFNNKNHLNDIILTLSYQDEKHVNSKMIDDL